MKTNVFFVEDWVVEREDAFRFSKERKERPILQYTSEFKIKDKFFYEYQNICHKLIIYTKHPGIWIGYHGKGNERFEEILKENFEHCVEVEYSEIKGDFLEVNY